MPVLGVASATSGGVGSKCSTAAVATSYAKLSGSLYSKPMMVVWTAASRCCRWNIVDESRFCFTSRNPCHERQITAGAATIAECLSGGVSCGTTSLTIRSSADCERPWHVSGKILFTARFAANSFPAKDICPDLDAADLFRKAFIFLVILELHVKFE